MEKRERDLVDLVSELTQEQMGKLGKWMENAGICHRTCFHAVSPCWEIVTKTGGRELIIVSPGGLSHALSIVVQRIGEEQQRIVAEKIRELIGESDK